MVSFPLIVPIISLIAHPEKTAKYNVDPIMHVINQQSIVQQIKNVSSNVKMIVLAMD